MRIKVPELSLVVLVGASGSGKSTFAARHFAPSEVLSSDFCRFLVSDDENDQSATRDAFAVLHFIAKKRLEGGRLTVIDASSGKRESPWSNSLGVSTSFPSPSSSTFPKRSASNETSRARTATSAPT